MKYSAPILAGLALILGGGILSASAQEYTPLASLPIGPGGSEPATWTLSTYLSGAIKLLVASAGALAVVMLVIGGTQYVAAGINPSAKGDAKERIGNALIGLILVLTSYLILNSIDPKLVQFNLTLPPVAAVPMVIYTPPSTSGGGTTTTGAGCTSCVTLSSSIPQKAPGSGCAMPGPCQVSSSILGKLTGLNQALKNKNINWQVTEAWPPTRKHKAACQNPGPAAGTCVDASILSQRTPANVAAFVSAASQNGLRAEYEVSTESRRQALIAGGVPAGSVKNFGSWITGEHFSVYNN
ncbi:MAG: hypothetical protein A2481_03790 [Candidatus Yonathbacteria bacterium RIFOXYC2_FULL_47_9]|nr:MAG: hypothetical protein A2481_03790 [Candidatus Yonathbacteria bacterium RIFOXYC2_FULL_47_9]HAT68253.1 hypothetical protein [Candidatus Yonathbacteria bacterium]